MKRGWPLRHEIVSWRYWFFKCTSNLITTLHLIVVFFSCCYCWWCCHLVILLLVLFFFSYALLCRYFLVVIVVVVPLLTSLFFSLSFFSLFLFLSLSLSDLREYRNIVKMSATSTSSSRPTSWIWRRLTSCSWWIWIRTSLWDSLSSIRNSCSTFKSLANQITCLPHQTEPGLLFPPTTPSPILPSPLGPLLPPVCIRFSTLDLDCEFCN